MVARCVIHVDVDLHVSASEVSSCVCSKHTTRSSKAHRERTALRQGSNHPSVTLTCVSACCRQLDEMMRMYDAAGIPADAADGGGVHAKSKMQQAYGKAIQSIAKYPMEITSAEEAEELQGSTNHGQRWLQWCRFTPASHLIRVRLCLAAVVAQSATFSPHVLDAS
jgi:hypothetical protein